MPDEVPTADDYASVDLAAKELQRRGWRRSFTVGQVVDGWASVVSSVEEGYDHSIYEFTNDVGIRRWAEEARPLLTPFVCQSMDEQLAPLDDRFRAATVLPARPRTGAESRFWWEDRLPILLVGEMADDVKRMGLGSAGS